MIPIGLVGVKRFYEVVTLALLDRRVNRVQFRTSGKLVTVLDLR